MLDEPHEMRLHTRRAINGSYNLKDPPGSPTIKYPGPQWVPDNLRAGALPKLLRVAYHVTHQPLMSPRVDCWTQSYLTNVNIVRSG